MASITKRSSGWQVQIRKQGYKPISKRFDKKSEAEAWARAIESEMDRNVFIDRSLAERTTLGEILIKYRDQVSIHHLGYIQEKSRVNVLLSHSIANRYLATLKSSD
ncbi:phage integrase [Methylotenera mobilis]|uniref:Phage integrase family protein n=1 Tax=Methylotenera mobilis (strain JLW8 / ATCC BAA-1282 / DSM 17540) TaxID=583345 RepID=C6WTY4_METML|nr:phage integrase [Methylotenera mobilis]ACT47383.1 phage integrase family protein [Methylotenera mobilis JLW8]